MLSVIEKMEPITTHQLVAIVAPFLPPEKARRRFLAQRHIGRHRAAQSIEEEIAIGRRDLVTRTLGHLIGQKKIERVSGKRNNNDSVWKLRRQPEDTTQE